MILKNNLKSKRGSTGKHWKLSDRTKEKMKNSHIGKRPSESHIKSLKFGWEKRKKKGLGIAWNKGEIGYLSKEKHYNWKGGITLLTKQIRSCFKYRQWRSDVFTKDDFTCQKCFMKSGVGMIVYLEAHHEKEFNKIIEEHKIRTLEEALNCEELWNINNGETLCDKCHNKTKRK